MAAPGHRQTASLSQNHKAQLASAYNELGKELSSQKIRVVGNYTLGKVIGEGMLDRLMSSVLSFTARDFFRCLWQSAHGGTPTDRYSGCY